MSEQIGVWINFKFKSRAAAFKILQSELELRQDHLFLREPLKGADVAVNFSQ